MTQRFNHRSRLTALFLWFFVSAPLWSSADETGGFPDTSTLNLTNGDYITGTLVSCPDNRCLGWRSPSFTRDLQLPIERVASIHFTPPAVLPKPGDAYGMELSGGDLLFGSLLGMDENTAEFDVPLLGGRLQIDRSMMTRLYRRGTGSEQLYVGPTGLNGWKTEGENRAWREINGQLVTNRPDAVLKRQFGIPARARFEIELSWKSQLDFDLAIGVSDKPESVAQAFRLQVWDNQVVLQRQTDKEADLERLYSVAELKGEHLHLQAFLDQPAGRMLVFSSDGKKLADLTVNSSKATVYGGIQLTNLKGDIRLERIQIGSWNGEPPQDLGRDKSRIHGTDGTITYGQLMSYNAEKHEFVINTGEETKTISEDKVQDLFLSQPAAPQPADLRTIFFSGMKVGGEYVKIDDGKLWLKSPGIRNPVAVTLNEIQSILVLKSTNDAVVELPGRKGRLEINGMTLHGCLVDGKVTDSDGLNWRPYCSSQSAPFQPGISGKIVYKDPVPAKEVAADDDAAQPRNAPQAAPRVLRARANAAARAGQTRKGTKSERAMLHLRTGDTVPCEAISIDENGFTFKSSVTESTFVPNSQIQALELMPNVPRKEIDPNKKSHLLTVPRMQRTNPPTHLIRSVEGDYLRGRLASMDAEQIQVELRLEVKMIPRDKVARILWLHPDGSEPEEKKDQPAEFDQSKLIQTLPSDGNRLTFAPEHIEANLLSGKSALLGSCKVDLQTVDQIYMGLAIDQATANLSFRWKLKKAADPLGPKEGSEGSEEGSEGMESALVGKQAPEIELKQLDGAAFQLSSYQGKIVILDFWASWCGPCMQVMPQVDRVAHEFADQGVVLFAVNLEESADKVKTALERLKLSTNVLLDTDGRVAEKYGATAIPQTVIIDREGKVVRLYVGGSARFDEQLRTALKSVLTNETPKGDTPKSDAAKSE